MGRLRHRGDTEAVAISVLVRGLKEIAGEAGVTTAELFDAIGTEKYPDLIVRVAGYSDYFNDLGRDLQTEIISRTEHHSF